MRKVLMTLMAMTMVCLQANAQMKPDKRYNPAYTYESYEDMDMVKVGKGWAARPIKVKGGGKAPGVVTLTKAFNDVWKVYVVSGILKKAQDPKFTYKSYPEYDSEDIVDRKSGYMCVNSGGTDSDYMESCVWRCDNGHRLFAILMGGPTDPEIEVVCFYDYAPETETMTPVESPVDTFKPKYEFYSYDLPRKGKDFIITEYDVTAEETVSHVYTWDGQKHVYGYDKKEKMK
jgi:hypothetical protein